VTTAQQWVIDELTQLTRIENTETAENEDPLAQNQTEAPTGEEEIVII
jgi:hypothetical protein